MSVMKRLFAARTCIVLLACASMFASTTYAVARPAKSGFAPAVQSEQGFPESHQPEHDPKPGEPGYLEPGPAQEPPEGRTDGELRAQDPVAYGQIVKERAQLERELIAKVHSALEKAGVASAKDDPKRTAEVLATTFSPYGYTRFTLVRNTTSPYARNGYLGTLYFVYGYYQPTTDSYRWYSVSWPARSGNNIPAYQGVVNVGPIPAYTWRFGFMYGAWRGYEPDGRVEFYPGKWRLDPWTGGPYGRSCLEVHGGTGLHEFAATSGCIRLYPSSISSLRSYYTYKMANKYDYGTAVLRVTY